MSNEYKLKFPKPILKKTDVTGNIPDIWRYPVPFAHKAEQYIFEGASFLNQQLYYDTFRLDMFHLITDEPFVIEYAIDQRRVFFNFVFHGQMHFTTGDDIPITSPGDCTLYLCTEQAGTYKARCPAGASDIVIISVEPGWVESIVENYPTLGEAVKRLFNSKNNYDVLPHCIINGKIKEWLFEILTLKMINRAMEQSLLSFRIGLALYDYEQMLLTTSKGKMFRIKQHIDLNFLSPMLDVGAMAELVFLSERTIMRRFKEEYKQSIHSYYTAVRFQFARQMIEIENKSIKETCEMLGHCELGYFRKAYKKYLAQLK